MNLEKEEEEEEEEVEEVEEEADLSQTRYFARCSSRPFLILRCFEVNFDCFSASLTMAR